MAMALRVSLTLLGLLYLYMGAGFVLDPAEAGANFGLVAENTMGLASMRADVVGFFLVTGGTLIWGAWSNRRDPLLVAAALPGIALIGRLINMAQHGTYEGAIMPMVVEAVTAGLALLAIKALPARN